MQDIETGPRLPAESEEAPQAAIRALAFYLPQFHPIPENDAWWEKGFTEWTNVSKAQPLFAGHDQPHVPADLGFYDLRLEEARIAQAELARAYQIHGFVYYHYWFGRGRRLLERPFQEVLDSGQPDFPFCLCWANESWSRRWMGEERDILSAQEYSPDDCRAHALFLCQVFQDPRQIHVHGRPLFLVYRPKDIPPELRFFDVLRDVACKSGIPDPWIVGVDAHCPGTDLRELGCDATLAFEPQLGALPEFANDRWSLTKFRQNRALGVTDAGLKLYDDAQARQLMIRHARWLMASRNLSFTSYPCVFVGWDNSPRRGRNGIIIVNGSPEGFRAALRQRIQEQTASGDPDPLVFVNAWNEWAEGNHLEPDMSHGRAYLDAVRSALLEQECSK